MPEGGRASRWNEDKGFGFIISHITQESIYVHRTGLVGVDALHEGDEVQFDRFQDAIDVKRGKERATNVHLVSRGADGGSSGSSAMHHGQADRALGGGRTNGGYGGDFSGGSAPRSFRESRHDGGSYRPEERPMSTGGHYGAGRVEIGTVKSWNDEKKFGFIIPDRGNESIYVHCTGLAGMEYLRDGDTVEFERFQDPHDIKRGKERAINVRLVGDSFSKTVSSVGGGGGGSAYGYSRQEPPRTSHLPPAPKPVIEVGRVSRWNDDKGFGFIVNNKTQESTYVHRTGLLGGTAVQEGDDVEYERFQDARDMERGKDRCINVRLLPTKRSKTSSSSLGVVFSQDDFGGYSSRGSSFGRDEHQYGRGEATYGRSDHSFNSSRAHPYAQAAPLGAPPGHYGGSRAEVGTLMSWNEEKGFGFILVQGSKESIYVHRTGFVDPAQQVQEGDSVEFARTQDQRDMERGKERAANVRVISGGGAIGGHGYQANYQNPSWNAMPPPQDFRPYDPGFGSPYGQESRGTSNTSRGFGGGGGGGNKSTEPYEYGTVAAWNDDKGFGFINCDITQESLYVHRTGLLNLEALQVGEQVEFGRTQDARDLERGKWRAINVRLVGGGGGGGGGGGRGRSRSPRRR